MDSKPSINFSGFKLGGTPTSKRKTQEFETENSSGPKRDFITGMSSNKIKSLNEKQKESILVIPLPERKNVRINSKYASLIRKKEAAKQGGDVEMQDQKMENFSSDKSTLGNEETNLNSTLSSEVSQAKYGLIVQTKSNTNNIPSNTSNSISITSIVDESVKDKVIEKEEIKKSIDEEAVEELIEDAKNKEKENLEINEDMDLPLLIKYRDTSLDEIEDEGERLRADVQSRPNESSVFDYERIPVDKYGKAMLMGMGWSEGAPIGLTNPKVVKPIEFVSRPGYRTGLGADPFAIPTKDKNGEFKQDKKKRKLKPGEKAEDFEPKVLAPTINSDGSLTARHVKHIDEKLIPLSKLKEMNSIQKGSKVNIISGLHDGLQGIVSGILDEENLIIKLISSNEDVKISKSDVMLQSRDSDAKLKEKSKSKESYKESSKESSRESSKDSKKKCWLFPHIVVRIVSKSFGNGSYYLKKAIVLDVIDIYNSTVQLMDSKKLLEVEQRMLETVIPKPREKVKILTGKYSGRLGQFLSKEKDSKDETLAVVQLLSEGGIIEKFPLESISQYIGEEDV